MGHYFVRYGVDPGVLLREDFYFGFHDAERDREIVARVEDPVPKDRRGSVPPALAVDLKFDADSLSDALHESHKLSHSVTGILSFVTCTGLPPPSLKFAFDVSEDRTDHDFLQMIDVPLGRRHARTLDPDSLNGFGAAFEKLPEEDQGAVIRAVRWIFHANEERNYLFRFLANWFALECVEPLLARRAGIRLRRRRGEPQTPGVAAFIPTLRDIPKGFYDDARDLRNDLVHGTVKLGKRGEDAKDLNPELASVAFRAIAAVTGWTPPRRLPEHIVYPGVPRRISLRTRVHAPKSGFFGPREGEAPRFDEGRVLRRAMNLREGKPAVVSDPRVLGPVMMAGTRFEPAALTVHGVEIDWIDINLVPVHRRG